MCGPCMNHVWNHSGELATRVCRASAGRGTAQTPTAPMTAAAAVLQHSKDDDRHAPLEHATSTGSWTRWALLGAGTLLDAAV